MGITLITLTLYAKKKEIIRLLPCRVVAATVALSHHGFGFWPADPWDPVRDLKACGWINIVKSRKTYRKLILGSKWIAKRSAMDPTNNPEGRCFFCWQFIAKILIGNPVHHPGYVCTYIYIYLQSNDVLIFLFIFFTLQEKHRQFYHVVWKFNL